MSLCLGSGDEYFGQTGDMGNIETRSGAIFQSVDFQKKGRPAFLLSLVHHPPKLLGVLSLWCCFVFGVVCPLRAFFFTIFMYIYI